MYIKLHKIMQTVTPQRAALRVHAQTCTNFTNVAMPVCEHCTFGSQGIRNYRDARVTL